MVESDIMHEAGGFWVLREQDMYLVCVQRGTHMEGKEIHRVVVNNPTERKVERILLGMLINMDTTRFYVDDSEFSSKFGDFQP